MQQSFDRALAAVLRHEGGYSNHPADNGGPTNKGITLSNFRRFVKADGTIADLKKLTTEQAGTVYRRQFWDAVAGSILPAGVDYCVFDMSVHSGPARAAKFLQAVVGVKQDGRIGPKTMAAVEKMTSADIINAMLDKRLAWLKKLSDWKSFGNGWGNRIDGVRKLALEMAAQQPSVPVDEPIPIEPETPATDAPTSSEDNGFKLNGRKVVGWLLAALFAAGVIYAIFA